MRVKAHLRLRQLGLEVRHTSSISRLYLAHISPRSHLRLRQLCLEVRHLREDVGALLVLPLHLLAVLLHLVRVRDRVRVRVRVRVKVRVRVS